MSDWYPCREVASDGTVCGGIVSFEVDGDWIYYRCNLCETERINHIKHPAESDGRERRLEQAQLPARFVGVRFEEAPENHEALRAIRDWLRDYRSNPLPAPAFWGPPGRGKSHLLTTLCRRLIGEYSASVLFRTLRSLLRELQQFESPAERDRAWQRATAVDVLALDDLGTQQMTDWRSDQLADLVDERYQAERPIVLATNFPPSAWPEAIDDRTASRLRGMTFAVELGGIDRREGGSAR